MGWEDSSQARGAQLALAAATGGLCGAGHEFCAGGAGALAEAPIAPHCTQDCKLPGARPEAGGERPLILGVGLSLGGTVLTICSG